MSSKQRDTVDLDDLTPQEVSDLTGLTLGTLRQYRYRGIGPRYSLKFGRVFYRRENVERYLNERTSRMGR